MNRGYDEMHWFFDALCESHRTGKATLFTINSKGVIDNMGGALRKSLTMYKVNGIPGVDQGKMFETATFGAGCFWGVEHHFRQKMGTRIRATCCGYMGGKVEQPTYDEVSTGTTDHAEVVQVQYFPDQVSYDDLVRYFYSIHDPTTKDRQGNDVGSQYRSVIYAHSAAQFATARTVTKQIEKEHFPGATLSTEVTMTSVDNFWPAEPEHQLFLERNPDGYCNHFERFQCTLKTPSGI